MTCSIVCGSTPVGLEDVGPRTGLEKQANAYIMAVLRGKHQGRDTIVPLMIHAALLQRHFQARRCSVTCSHEHQVIHIELRSSHCIAHALSVVELYGSEDALGHR